MVDLSIGDRELDVLAALWRDGPGTVDEVRERLPATLAYNTVLTILRNLEQKEFVDHTVVGRLHRYFAVIAEDAVRGNMLSRLVDKLFSGSTVGMLTHLVEQEKLSRQEMRELHALLDGQVSSKPTLAKKSRGKRK